LTDHRVVPSFPTRRSSDLKASASRRTELNFQLNSARTSPILFPLGSPTATHCLIEQNLIDGFWLFLNPIILGQGIPLFKNIENKDRKSTRLNSSHVKISYA